EKAEAAVAVLMVVPVEEILTERAAVFDRSESLGKPWTVFERFEVRFREGIIVRDVRAAVRLGHAEVGEQERDGLALHRRTAVRMELELTELNAMLRACLGDETLGEGRALMWRERPADDAAAEDVENHVEIEVGPLSWAQQLRDVPAPDFVGPSRQ